jgi:hypothetical protein
MLMLFTMAVNGIAQNLVPNPSFEDTIHCPTSLGDAGMLVSWSNYANTSDYFNECHTTPVSAGVPSNWYGYQQPKSGKGYYGMITYTGTGSYREIIGTTLTTPLVIGQKYYASFSACMANCTIEGGEGANKLGFLFTNTSYTEASPIPINNFAHIYSDSIIVDTLNWIRQIGSFVADSTYTNFAFGNFFDDANTNSLDAIGCGSSTAYYYIDDLCISTDSLEAYNFVGISDLSNISNLKIYPNPVNEYLNINTTNETYDLTIFNSLGQVIFMEKNIRDTNKRISTNQFDSGLLFINIKTKNLNLYYKFFKT